MTDDRTWRIAVHESGHCVAARLLKLPAGEASIIEPRAHAVFSTDAACGADAVVALMGGSAAEEILLGDFDRGGNRVDRERVRARLERLGYTDNGQALWAHTLGLLRPQVSLITFLAHKLKRAGGLAGAEIDRIVRRHRWPSR